MRIRSLLTLAACLLASQAALADASADFQTLLDEAWEWHLAENPMVASRAGDRRYNKEWSDGSLAAIERRHLERRDFLRRVYAIDRAALPEADKLNYELFRRDLQRRVDEHQFKGYLMPFSQRGGVQNLDSQASYLRFETVGDYEDWLARMDKIDTVVDQTIEVANRGIEQGRVLPRVLMERIPEQIAVQLVDKGEDSPFYRTFETMPDAIGQKDQQRLRTAAVKTIEDTVVPAYRKLARYFDKTYLPATRDTVGLSNLPNGSAWYEFLARRYTTTLMTPDEIHRTGLEEVKRIRGEMQAIIDELGFEGDFRGFLTFLRTDPQFYVETPEALLKEAAFIAKRMDGKLPALFGRLPRLPYTVEPVPDYLAPKYTTGRYVGAPWGSSEPGRYWVNTYNLASRPLYNLEALSLHEAVPGHHLQIALNQEIEGLPNFRRFSYISAFGEGWGLYSEWLGLEAGFYTDPYSNFGRLTYEMWRACRLVVDTGVHAFGWTREQMIEFLASNTALPLHEVETETDRYISWPGQAPAYKPGELEIKKLRREAEEALGENFDVRAFHDAVLANGSVPLPVLRQAIEIFIASRR